LTAKLDEKTLEALKTISERTRIPQSELIREGISWVLRRHSEDILTPEFKNEIEALLKEDSGLLKRLSKD
ncbi:MAG: ribbon-helix-helix domain-containing protein, partial [Elusimicrobia bacterium]|nr:ribbon-helix-helix domain-containing protein [Elusimicrobiota bacterium]